MDRNMASELDGSMLVGGGFGFHPRPSSAMYFGPMHYRRFSCVPVVLCLAAGGMFSGCDRDKGAAPDAQVDALRLSTELERTKKKLEADAKALAEKDDAVLLAKA